MLNFRNKLLLFFISILSAASSEEKPFIIGELRYELGNQMFQVAAAVSLALDAGFEPLFPELNSRSWGIPDNYRYVFWRLNASPPVGQVKYIFNEWDSGGQFPIPAKPNMLLQGYFQSEKYFANHKEEILSLFAPSDEVMSYLEMKYSEILAHPNIVAIHVRTYIKDYGHPPRQDEFHAFPGTGYYERAVRLFPEDSLFYSLFR